MNPNSDPRTLVASQSYQHKAVIEASPAAFKALYSDTYTNKIGAVVREIVSNAVDSHNKAEITRPVDVTLPNDFNPFFVVEDYGIGIEPSMVWDLALGYFKSTKQGSDDDIGGFGVGFKSPLSYADMFDVHNTFDGITTIYRFIIDEEGTPAGDIINTERTDRGNGVKVIVPVLDSDIQTFHDEVNEQLKFITPKPNINALSGFKFNHFETPELYNFFDASKAPKLPQISLSVGGVGYAIGKSYLPKTKDMLRIITGKKLVIKTPINAVSPALSREHLSYDNKTVSYLEKIDEEIHDILFNSVKDEFLSLKTMSDWYDLPHHKKVIFGLLRNHFKPEEMILDDIDLKMVTENEITSGHLDGKVFYDQHRVRMYNLSGNLQGIKIAKHQRICTTEFTLVVDDLKKRKGVGVIRNMIHMKYNLMNDQYKSRIILEYGNCPDFISELSEYLLDLGAKVNVIYLQDMMDVHGEDILSRYKKEKKEKKETVTLFDQHRRYGETVEYTIDQLVDLDKVFVVRGGNFSGVAGKIRQACEVDANFLNFRIGFINITTSNILKRHPDYSDNAVEYEDGSTVRNALDDLVPGFSDNMLEAYRNRVQYSNASDVTMCDTNAHIHKEFYGLFGIDIDQIAKARESYVKPNTKPKWFHSCDDFLSSNERTKVKEEMIDTKPLKDRVSRIVRSIRDHFNYFNLSEWDLTSKLSRETPFKKTEMKVFKAMAQEIMKNGNF